MTNSEAKRGNAQSCADIFRRISEQKVALDISRALGTRLLDEHERLNRLVEISPDGEYIEPKD